MQIVCLICYGNIHIIIIGVHKLWWTMKWPAEMQTHNFTSLSPHDMANSIKLLSHVSIVCHASCATCFVVWCTMTSRTISIDLLYKLIRHSLSSLPILSFVWLDFCYISDAKNCWFFTCYSFTSFFSFLILTIYIFIENGYNFRTYHICCEHDPHD